MNTGTAARLVLVALLTTLGFLIALWLVYQLQTIIVWSILALFLTVGLRPAVDWLTSRRAPRALAILLAYLGLIVVAAAVAALVAPTLFQQATGLVHAFQQPGGLTGEIERLARPLGLDSVARSLRPQLDALPGQLASSIGSFSTVTASTIGTVTAVLSVGVLTFFFLHDGAALVEASVRLVPERHRERARRLIRQSEDAIFGYIRGNLAISAIAGT